MMRLEEVTKRYLVGDHTVNALAGISLTIEANSYIAFIGSSGSGKSTMMNLLGCLDRPTSGRYVLNGKAIADMSEQELAVVRNQEVGFIFQSFNLLPRLTVLQNVIQPLVYRRMAAAERKERAWKALRRVGLDGRAAHLPSQISGGQRQRVAIARALVTEPSILLADEPTGNLDSRTAAEILEVFDQLHAEGATLVVVTHDPKVAQRSSRVVTLSDGQVERDERRAAA
ncbi:ABC transporter ATP-binding protein [Sphingomonas crusticola]|uniref:ABC transporter ATP-binding protein n=1 Tax=Sphingomonas crusticola TaxID=1697973 RepID=UPI000E2800C1|nr:ABC transporter ATP-binding protein [Sphingomonas crusticola]